MSRIVDKPYFTHSAYSAFTPLGELRTAPLPHRRNVTGNLAGIGITISNDTKRGLR